MIEKNYIIQAHKNPNQLARMIDRLKDGYSHFFIHIDLKSDVESFKAVLVGTHITFIKNRVNCVWGDFSQVEATIHLMEAVRASGRKYRMIFLSGQDYPIKSSRAINMFFENNIDEDFIEYSMDPIPISSKTYKDRIERYKFNFSNRKLDVVLLNPIGNFNVHDLKNLVKIILKGRVLKIDYSLLMRKREYPFHEHYKGSNWWSLSYPTWTKILEYIHEHKDILYTYYSRMLCADEQFFQTILRGIMKNDVTIRLKDHLHYVDWSGREKGSPIVFTDDHFGVLSSQPENKLFARKFDSDIDSSIMDRIDERILFARQ